MSRCFPYPPPGYKSNCARGDESVIESIKLRIEGKKAKKERREEKAAKKERREEKKARKERRKEKKWEEGEKTRRNGEIEHQKQSHKKRLKDDMQQDHKGGEHETRRGNETDHFERSSLTEEHGHPIGYQNLCYSSDGSPDSNKRLKYSSAPDCRHNSGSIIRIRLPSKRQEDLEVLPSIEQPCFSLGTTDAFVQEMHDPVPNPGREEGEHTYFAMRIPDEGLHSKLAKENPSSTSAVAEIFGQKAKTTPVSSSCGSGSSLELRYKSLLDNWAPPLIHSHCPAFDDQEWLLETKQNHKIGPQRCETTHNIRSYGNSTPWPRVCYLAEVDIYALPFTVPF